MCVYIFTILYLNVAVNISLCIELYYYLRILDTVYCLIIMCNLLILKRFPEEDKQYIYRKFGKLFSLLFSSRNFIKTETYNCMTVIDFRSVETIVKNLAAENYLLCIFLNLKI